MQMKIDKKNYVVYNIKVGSGGIEVALGKGVAMEKIIIVMYIIMLTLLILEKRK